MFTLSVEWGMGWERSLITQLPSQEKPLRPPTGPSKPYKKQQIERIKATSLHRKVTKTPQTMRKTTRGQKQGVAGGGGAVGAKSLPDRGTTRGAVMTRFCDGISRRDFVRAGAIGSAFTLADYLRVAHA